MKKCRILPALFCLVMIAPLKAAPSRFECPAALPANAIKVDNPFPGWTPYVASPLYLSNAAPADGPPERLGILRGEDVKRTKSSWTHQYSLEGAYPEGKWLRCDYGMLGEVAMAVRLPDDIKACTVKGRKGPHAGENAFEITCQ
ncbi:STY0301 family protein [Pseudoduganella ginsengisoli]|uniref:DUF3757 domain-containing protein n=1 Tax=Pseudoduganella ginsengisoli TaxID=1462440 RepID=A0A6L6PUX0_9BURK|nr:STY0301 family protein [Pseudoduganella ginsengisoli]MTW01287.1 hypothetical protein [Pseudoduganella ginsengisoli]